MPPSRFHYCSPAPFWLAAGVSRGIWRRVKRATPSSSACQTANNAPRLAACRPSSITVYRWDNMHDNVLVWDAEPESPLAANNISGLVTWGAPPKGWTNKLTPPALICGKAYLLNPGAHYFALKCDGTVTVFEATKLEEFFRDNKSATPVKGDPRNDTKGPE